MFGLDISDGSLEFLYLGRAGVICSARLQLEPGIVEAGEIIDAAALAQKIKQGLTKLRQQKNFPRSAVDVIISLPEGKTYLYCFELPLSLKGAELDAQVRKKAAAMLPLDFSNLYWDYLAAPIVGAQSIIFAAATKKIVNDYRQVLAAAGLYLKIIDAESLSLARALLHLEHAQGQTMIADIGYRSTDLSLYDQQGVLRLSVSLPVAGAQMTEAVAAKLGISQEEAEKLKCAKGLEPGKRNAAYGVLLSKAAQISHGLAQAIAYEEGRQKMPVKHVVLAGGSALLPGLVEYLEKELVRKISLARPFIKLGLKASDDPAQLFYANVSGLAVLAENLRLPHLNLLAQEYQETETAGKHGFDLSWIRKLLPVLVIFVIFAIMVLLVIRFKVFDYFSQKQVAQMPEATSTIAILPTEPAVVPAVVPSASATLPMSIATSSNQLASTATLAIAQIIKWAEVTATPTGYLNVRNDSNAAAAIVTKIYPQARYVLVETRGEWYKLQISDKTLGWVSSRYIKIINQ